MNRGQKNSNRQVGGGRTCCTILIIIMATYAKQYPVAGFSVYVRYTGQKRELGAGCGRFGHTATHSAIRSGLFWFFSLISVFSSGFLSIHAD